VIQANVCVEAPEALAAHRRRDCRGKTHGFGAAEPVSHWRPGDLAIEANIDDSPVMAT